MRCGDCRKTKTDGIDDLLAIDKHGQGPAHPLVLKVWALRIPANVVKAWIVIFRLRELLIKSGPAGLLRVLNRQQPWIEIHFPCLEGGQSCRLVLNDTDDDLI